MDFLQLLRARVVEVTRDRGRLELEVGPEHLRDLGILHGGVLATLLDTVMGMAATARAPAGHFTVTMQLNINFTRPAWEGETLVATSEVRHSGRQTAVAFGEVRTAQGLLVGTGSGTFMYILHTDPDRQRFDRQADEQGNQASSAE